MFYIIYQAEVGLYQQVIIRLGSMLLLAGRPMGYLAYYVKDEQRNENVLLAYNIKLDLVWEVARSVDTVIQPVWSWGCQYGLRQNCYLAYGKKSNETTQIAIMNLETNQVDYQSVRSGRGYMLAWSPDNDLYYGRLKWFRVQDNQPLVSAHHQTDQAMLSPRRTYLVYMAQDGKDDQKIQKQGIWLQNLITAQIALGHLLWQKRKRGLDIFWSSQDTHLAFFDQGRLWYYEIQKDQSKLTINRTFLRYQPEVLDILPGQAFSPQGEALAFVEGVYLNNPEKPHQGLVVVDGTGITTILRPWSRQPIVLLAWLPSWVHEVSEPYLGHEFVKQFQ